MHWEKCWSWMGLSHSWDKDRRQTSRHTERVERIGWVGKRNRMTEVDEWREGDRYIRMKMKLLCRQWRMDRIGWNGVEWDDWDRRWMKREWEIFQDLAPNPSNLVLLPSAVVISPCSPCLLCILLCLLSVWPISSVGWDWSGRLVDLGKNRREEKIRAQHPNPKGTDLWTNA